MMTNNVGHSPAVRVDGEYRFIQPKLELSDTWQQLKKLCQVAEEMSANSKYRGVTGTIFPNSSGPRLVDFPLEPKPREWFPEDPNYVMPVILWCTAYRSDFSPVIHHTGYAWEIWRKSVGAGHGIYTKGGSVQAEDLILTRSIVGPLVD